MPKIPDPPATAPRLDHDPGAPRRATLTSLLRLRCRHCDETVYVTMNYGLNLCPHCMHLAEFEMQWGRVSILFEPED